MGSYVDPFFGLLACAQDLPCVLSATSEFVALLLGLRDAVGPLRRGRELP